MTNIIMKDGKKRKVSHKKLQVNHILSYKCPSCNDIMGLSVQSVFTRVDYGYEIWICEKCKKEFRLCFQEIVEDKNELEKRNEFRRK